LKLGVMQPYLFPYIGYFQLITEVDTFVFYDDVNFIKAGWINRNRIFIDDKAKYFTVPCKGISQNKLIFEIDHALDEKTRRKLLNKIQSSYGNAPFFNSVLPLFESVIYSDSKTIADLAISSVCQTMDYLNTGTDFKISSEAYDNRSLNGMESVLDICKREGAAIYVNPIGGRQLYSKKAFSEQGVQLKFLHSESIMYKQFKGNFVEGLSILDVMMFNSKQKVQDFLRSYTLI